MPYDVTASFSKEQAKISGSYPLDMYVFNATYSGKEYYYFVNHDSNVVGYSLDSNGAVTSATTTYTAVPMKRGSQSTNTSGELTTIDITFPNTNRVIEDFIQDRDYLRGNEVHVITMFSRHLPTGLNEKYLGSDPDYRSNINETYYVDSVQSNESEITFNCKAKFDIKKVSLPRRRYSHECMWALNNTYLGSFCDPNLEVDSVTYTTCDGTLEECRQRENSKRYGGFPGIMRNAIWVR